MCYVNNDAETRSALFLWASDFLVDIATKGDAGFGGKKN